MPGFFHYDPTTGKARLGNIQLSSKDTAGILSGQYDLARQVKDWMGSENSGLTQEDLQAAQGWKYAPQGAGPVLAGNWKLDPQTMQRIMNYPNQPQMASPKPAAAPMKAQAGQQAGWLGTGFEGV
jgi:hypothetical protein